MKPVSDMVGGLNQLNNMLSGSLSSRTTEKTAVYSSVRPGVKVIVNMEASGTFLSNVAIVLAATGMNLEELFVYLAEAATSQFRDRFVETPLINGRLPDAEAQTITALMGGLVDQLTQETSGVLEQVGDFKLLKIDVADNSAIIETAGIKPRAARPIAISTDVVRRPKTSDRSAIGTIAGSNIVRVKRRGLE